MSNADSFPDPDSPAVTPTPRGCWLAGTEEPGRAGDQPVSHPYDGSEVATVSIPDDEQVRTAITLAASAHDRSHAFGPAERARVLELVARRLVSEAEDTAETVTAESGKPLTWARAEVEHAVAVLRAGAAASAAANHGTAGTGSRWHGHGEVVVSRRLPAGPALGLVSSDDPLLSAVTWATAAVVVGAPLLLAPPPATPLSALLVGELFASTELPRGELSVLPLEPARLPELGWDQHVRVLAPAVPDGDGFPRLGPARPDGPGDTAVLVAADWSSPADLDVVARLVVDGAMAQAGRSAASVRRVVVPAASAEDLVRRIVTTTGALTTGSPHDPAVEVGPLGDELAARTAQRWVERAVSAGAVLRAGGRRDGGVLEPTVLSSMPPRSDVWSEPAPLGPVLLVAEAEDDAAATDTVTRSAPGRLAVFTRRFGPALTALTRGPAAEVVVGGLPSVWPLAAFDAAETAARSALDAAVEALTVERRLVLRGGTGGWLG
ncbi:aldehyde dehydrogenase family protein [Actinoalloteichus spitiensis]|uniref:aldehyde dehydrogenase family protein n=1 Tax=Actinoalloteichus spitiensis TaxID=252394 RepID=UPI00146DAE6F|nr:aldehyde dehydrogenase family protein [Actinoalloteichus spitiensis]